jgi:cobyrinic acid a,c-diamide synthase
MLVPTHTTGLANALAAAVSEIATAQGQRVRYHHLGPLTAMSAWDRWEGAAFLDPTLYDEHSLIALYDVATRGAQLSLLSTNVGILDTRTGSDWSPAGVAALLDCPVVAVLDCRGWGAGIRALLAGLRAELTGVNLAGVILTGLADPEHCEELRTVMRAQGIPVLGCLLASGGLGWEAMAPGPWGLPLHKDLLETVARQVDLGELQALAGQRGFLSPQTWLTDRGAGGPLVLVAGGRGFTPWSRDSIEVLRSAGARVRRLDLLEDKSLPPETSGLVLAGTLWPAALTELAGNESLLNDIRRLVLQGLPTIALGGGMLYLLETVQDSLGRTAQLAGILPGQGEILWDLEVPAYAQVTAQRDNLLLRAGERLTGWVATEMEIATLSQGEAAPFLVRPAATKDEVNEGVMSENLLCSRTFVHLAGSPDRAERFVHRCARYVRQHD